MKLEFSRQFFEMYSNMKFITLKAHGGMEVLLRLYTFLLLSGQETRHTLIIEFRFARCSYRQICIVGEY